MAKKTTTKKSSTFDRIMRDPERKKQFEREYKDLVLSELLLALMENDEKSVRLLAKEAGLSPTVIQNIRSGKQKDIKLDNILIHEIITIRIEQQVYCFLTERFDVFQHRF